MTKKYNFRLDLVINIQMSTGCKSETRPDIFFIMQKYAQIATKQILQQNRDSVCVNMFEFSGEWDFKEIVTVCAFTIIRRRIIMFFQTLFTENSPKEKKSPPQKNA